jgi:hypothetical protein
MAEMDAFDRGLAGAFLRLVDDVPGDVDAIAVAHRVALEHPRRARAGSGGMVAAPRLAWILLLAILLAAAGAAAVFVGSQRTAPPAPALLETAPAAVTFAPAVLAPAATVAPDATPVDLPPGVLSPAEAAARGVPVVTPSALGRISWTVWLPSGLPAGVVPLSTPHGLVLLAGENLIWRSPAGGWTGAPILGTTTWPGAAVGDDLILTDQPRPARFHWTGSDWVRAGSPEGLDGFYVSGLVSSSDAIVAFGPSGIASSSDGIGFVKAVDGPGCVISMTSTGDGFVALSGPCGGGATINDRPDSLYNQRSTEPIPWTSADGLSWQRAATVSPFGPGATITGVASRGGRHVAIGVARRDVGQASAIAAFESAVWVSDDGLAWRRIEPLPEAPTVSGVNAWVFGYRTIVSSDAGWLIETWFNNNWTSADGLAWEPLHGVPSIFFGYFPPVPAMDSDLIAVGSTPGGTGAGVLIGTILKP